jgi:hypothetical protein
VALILLLVAAWGHDLQPGVVALREVAPDTFAVRLTPPKDGSGRGARFRPEWPEGCRVADGRLHCALDGWMRLPDLRERRTKTVVSVRWQDGTQLDALLTEGQDAVHLSRDDARTTRTRGWLAYLALGWEHVLEGWDHLGFVVGLALVARRRVLWAMTAFTAAHALTLGAASMGLVAVPASAELLIAASVLLMAREATTDADTLTRRRPWVVALAFGLLHGLGFASGLQGWGLPTEQELPAILAFHVGVEAGQLAVLAAFAVAWRATAGFGPARARWFAYPVGLAAGVWVVQRLLDHVG